MVPRTYLLDLDGCVFRHHGAGASAQWFGEHELLPGVEDFFNRAEKEGACIILVTARKESCRDRLISELRMHGLFYDHLVMGVTHGERVVINDAKSEDQESARAVILDRNQGLIGCE